MEQVHPSPVRILVIEDNPADVELLRMALDRAAFGYEMTVIHDGAEALATFRKENVDGGGPDIAILDLNLPKYGGLDILEAARANAGFAKMPIAILSSSSSPREQTRIQMFDRVKYIVKPLDLDQYLRIGQQIRDFVEESRRQTTAERGEKR